MQEKEIFRIRGIDMESVMNQENSFHYKYSAVENREIEEIRKKYIPAVESKMGELKRLDAQVEKSWRGECFVYRYSWKPNFRIRVVLCNACIRIRCIDNVLRNYFRAYRYFL